MIPQNGRRFKKLQIPKSISHEAVNWNYNYVHQVDTRSYKNETLTVRILQPS